MPHDREWVVRIVGHQRYPNTPGSPTVVAAIVARLRDLPGHCFWADDISLIGSDQIEAARILTSAQVTDTYLLALASVHGGRLATLDRRLSVAAVKDGKAALHLIAPG